MIKSTVLFDNEWIQMRKMTDDEEPKIKGYIYSHEARCAGHIVACVPFRRRNGDSLEFMFRCEATPCWLGKSVVPSSFTGGVDFNMRHLDPVATMEKELREETGVIGGFNIIPLGSCFGSKSSDTVYHLYTVDFTNVDFADKLHSESELESTAFCTWVDGENMYIEEFNVFQYLQDPIAAQIILRIMIAEKFNGNEKAKFSFS